MSDFKDDLAERIAPLLADDDGTGDAYVAAAASVFDQVHDLATDKLTTVDNHPHVVPGWSDIMDPDVAPDYALGWLGQFVGVRLDPRLDDTAQRIRIRATTGRWRGTPAAMTVAIQAVLTGTKTVNITERDTSPYHFNVYTNASETPSAGLVIDAIEASKPAGLQYYYNLAALINYNYLRDGFNTFTALTARYSTFNHMRDNV